MYLRRLRRNDARDKSTVVSPTQKSHTPADYCRRRHSEFGRSPRTGEARNECGGRNGALFESTERREAARLAKPKPFIIKYIEFQWLLIVPEGRRCAMNGLNYFLLPMLLELGSRVIVARV